MNFRNLRLFWSTWWRTITYSLLIIILWLAYGKLLSQPYFDNGDLELFKVLNHNTTLTFMSVVLAVQIPIFILFLESMRNSGYVLKILLPTVTRFRETVAILLTCASLILMSPQEPYLYMVVAVFILVNISAVIQAFEVVFRMDNGYADKIQKGLKHLARHAFREALDDRMTANRSYNWIKKNDPTVKLNIFSNKAEDALLIKSHKDGHLKGVRIRYSNILIKLLVRAHGDIRIEMLTTYGTDVKKNVNIIKAYSDKPINKIWAFLIRSMVIIGDKSHYVATYERVFDDLESSLLLGVEKDNERIVKETLLLHGSITNALDSLVQDNMVNRDSNYNLEQAINDIMGGDIFNNDGLSSILSMSYNVMDRATTQAIKESREKTGKLLVSKSYSALYSAISNNKMLGIARNESLQNSILQRFIYDEVLCKNMSDIQNTISEKSISLVQEGSRIIAWQVEEKDLGDSGRELLVKRIENIRTLIIGSYKNNLPNFYNDLLKILLGFDSRRDGYLEGDHELSDLVATSLFMTLAYMLQRNDLSSSYARNILDRATKWPLVKLTKIAAGSIDNNLAHEWRFDTLDLQADTGMQQVPNFDVEIRKLWVIIVSRQSNIPTDASRYGNEQLLGSTLFFTDGASSKENLGIYGHLDTISDDKIKNQVRSAIDSLVSVRFNEEHRAVADASLDEDKVRLYTEHVNSSFAESSDIIKIFDKQGRHYVESTKKIGSDYKEVAYNTPWDKEMFMDLKWHIGYSVEYQGDDIGKNVARGLDKGIFPIMLSNAEQISELDELLSEVKSYGGEWIVLSNRVYDFESRRKLNLYMSNNSTFTEQKIKGINQKVPILTINMRNLSSGLYFIKRSEIGKIIHPKNSNEYVKVDIRSYSNNPVILSRLLSARPDWLKKKGNSDAQKHFLLTKVLLYVAFIFKYMPSENRRVLFYSINEDF